MSDQTYTKKIAAPYYGLFFLLLVGISGWSYTTHADDVTTTLEVIDSYVEVRTGPGRGYPIFYVIEQGESIDILTRRTGWYEIKSANGKTGWATSAQLSRTLQPTGEPADLPTVSFGDYQKNNWRVGFSGGEFFGGELKSTDFFSVSASYRFLSWLSVGAEWGRVFNSGQSGDLYSGNILVEPFSHWRVSPELILGRGTLSLESQPELVNLGGQDSDVTLYGLGLNTYIGRNFVIRGEYNYYSVSADNDKENLDAWKIGFNTFF